MIGNGSMIFGESYMWFFWIIFFIIIIYLPKNSFTNNRDNTRINKTETAMGILEKHYASGEIIDDEFNHQQEQLKNK